MPASPQSPLWSEGTIAVRGQSSYAFITPDVTTDSWSTTSGVANFVLVGVPIAAAPCQ